VKKRFCTFAFFCGSFFLFLSELAFAHTTYQVSNAAELQTALSTAGNGDTIILQSGSYGELSISNRNNSIPITIVANRGSVPVFTKVSVSSSSRWTIRGLHVRPRFTNGADGNTAVSLNGSYLVFEDSNVNFSDDIFDWIASDWLTKTGNGIGMVGDNLTIRNNMIRNVDHGIHGGATDSIVSRNTIMNFRGDGIRGLGDRMVYEYNLIKNSYNVDDNHDDGFQSWSLGSGGVGTGVVRDVTLRGNTFINYEDQNQNLRSTMQGIGLFDGTFVNWTIENNLVVTDHWHGITMLGVRDSLVVNNTVLDTNTEGPGPPWIQIAEHKNGTPPSGVIVRNNLSTSYSLSSTGVIADHNIEIDMNNLGEHFVDAASGNFHLKQSSTAVDAGTSDSAPSIDIEGKPRPQGLAHDVGAFEYNDSFVFGELAVDFGSNGLWHYDGSWTSLASWNPDGLVEWTGGMAVDFDTYGTWNYDGTTWTQLAGWNPEDDMVNWIDGIAVDFGANGLWSYDGSSWTSLASWNPDGMGEWTGGLAVNFGATYGLWNYDGTTWTQLASWEAEYGIAWNSGLAIDFGSNGLWYYDGSSWTILASWNPDGLVEWTGGMAVDFDTYGTWNYNGTTWTQLAGWNPEDDMVNWIDGIAVDFGANGLWSYDGSSWTSLAGWNPEEIEAWANGLAADFGAVYGLWNYSGSAWSSLAGWDSEDIIDLY